jgi:hypothetical protein
MRLAQRSLRAAEHWLARANETGAQAEQMRDPDARRELLQIVESYLRLAMLAAGLLGENKTIHRLN